MYLVQWSQRLTKTCHRPGLMRAVKFARTGLLATIALSAAFILIVILSSSEHNTSPRGQLKQFAAQLVDTVRVFSSSHRRCQPAVSRSEEEVERCFRLLAEEVALSWKQHNRTMKTVKRTLGTKTYRMQRFKRQLALKQKERQKFLQKKDKLITDNLQIKSERIIHGQPFSSDMLKSIARDIHDIETNSRFSISDDKRQKENPGNQTFPYFSVLQNLTDSFKPSKCRGSLNNETSASSHPLTKSEIENRFALRRATLQNMCRCFSNSTLFRKRKKRGVILQAFWPVTNVSVRYCPIQKTGSTTWTRQLKAIRKERQSKLADGSFRPKNPGRFKKTLARRYSGNTAENSSSSLIREVSFIFVREPYSRLLSAYVDKMFSPNTLFWDSTGKYVIQNFRPNPSQQSLRCGHDVTFPEFIRYVIHAQETGIHRDGHFVPAHDHCDLCVAEYDYIGHLETIKEDMPFLLNLIRDAQTPNLTDEFEHDTIANNAKWVFGRMKAGIKACMSMDEAGRRLWRKWQIRGLIGKQHAFPFTPVQAETASVEEVVGTTLRVLGAGGDYDVKKQKKEALKEAYSLVPLKDRLKLRELLFLDFAMFGFNPEPEVSRLSSDEVRDYFTSSVSPVYQSEEQEPSFGSSFLGRPERLFQQERPPEGKAESGNRENQDNQQSPQGQDEEKSARSARLTPEQVAERFRRRVETLRAACKLYGNSSMFQPSRRVAYRRLGPFPPAMNVSVGYCPIQKTSSTTWSGIFKAVRVAMKERGVREVISRRKENVLFMFVREPYSRLLSAYVDKLFSPNTLFWRTTGRYIIQMFRHNASETSLRCGHDVTFPEFIRYFIHAQTTRKHRDGHFIPSHEHCDVCRVPYTHVGHLETLSEDMPYLLNVSQASITYSKDFDNSTLSNNAGWVLKAMRKGISQCMSMEEACHRLWKKWHIRGIIDKRQPLPITAQQAVNISKEEFVQLALEALERSGPKEERKRQKMEALREAFASVPLQDRLLVQRLLFLDFTFFGFDSNPETVFSTTPILPQDSYRYFNLKRD